MSTIDYFPPARRIFLLRILRASSILTFLLLAFGMHLWAQESTLARQLLPEERTWLSTHPVLRVAAPINLPPLQMVDKGGRFIGVAGDYMRLIEQRLGISFLIVPIPNWEQVFVQAKSGQIDIIFSVIETPERRAFLDFTDVLYELPQVLIVNANRSDIRDVQDLRGKRVGVIKGTSFQEWLQFRHPQAMVVPLAGAEDGVKALATGDTDAFIGDLATASYAIQRLGVSNLRVVAEVGDPTQLRIAVRKGLTPLGSVLDKTISTISARDHKVIRDRWLALAQQGIELRKILLIVAPIFSAIVLLILLLSNLRLRKQNQARRLAEEELARHKDHLEELVEERTEQLARREEWARTIIDTVAYGIIIYGQDGKIGTINAAARQLLRCKSDELLGTAFIRLFRQEERDRLLSKMQQPAQRNEEDDPEDVWAAVVVRGDGSMFLAEFVRRIFLIEASPHTIVSFRDVTERKKVEEALRKNADEIADLYNNAPCGYHSLDENGVFLRINDTELRWLDRSREEIIGRMNIRQLLTPQSWEIFVKSFPIFKKQGWINNLELDFIRKKGEELPVLLSATVVPNEQGGYLMSRSTMFDNTEKKQIIKELRLAKKEADEANQAKSSFLANMSHEIRTPMNAVIGFANLALKTDLSARQRDYVSKIHNAGVSLLGLINDILDFSKIEAGKLSMEAVDFTLDAVIENVVAAVAHATAEKGLELLINVPRDIPQYLIGDPHRLGQVLTNLIGNSVKFTNEGEIELSVALLERTGEKAKVRFLVRDTGIGMSENQLTSLFRPFSQADNSTTRKYGGTGLGLSISRHLVEVMGGQIWVESSIGKGSTFTFTAWFDIAVEQRPQHLMPRKLEGMRVLVVDDNAGAREIMHDVLSSLRFRVETAASGEEGVSAVKAADAIDPFHLVVMDWKMPGIDGIEATRQLTAKESLRNPPVVLMLSASGAGEEQRAIAMQAGAADFLAKPVTPSTLVEAILKAFAPEVLPAMTSSPKESVEVRELIGARVLLVEDNEINQQIATELLRGAGVGTVIASNGREAYEILEHESDNFDLVLMDVQMPEMDGYEATRRIRSQSWGSKIPIIAMTAHALVEEREKAMHVGMNDHISKPIDPEAMFATMHRYFNRKSLPASETQAAASGKEEAPLLSIEGIDVTAALARVAGNRRLYVDLLRGFANGQVDLARKIGIALGKEDFELAERLAHTLRGIAGNLGVGSVQALASAIENQIRGRDPSNEIEKNIDELDATLRSTAGKIQAVFPVEEPHLVTKIDKKALKELPTMVVKLQKLIEENDSEALDLFETIRESLEVVASTEAVSQLRERLQGYDFASSLSILKRINEGLEKTR